MCGRFALKTKPPKVAKLFQADLLEEYKTSYNIPPTTQIPIVRKDPITGKRSLKTVKWSLPLFDPKTEKFVFRLNNARAETITEKKTFSKHFREDRCLIPADGFFEWKDLGGKKQPYYISMKDDSTFAFAGIWDRRNIDKQNVESCSVITTEPNDLMKKIHDRMPVILDPKDWEAWLDPALQDENFLKGFLKSYPTEKMQAWPVNKLVGDSEECIEKIEAH